MWWPSEQAAADIYIWRACVGGTHICLRELGEHCLHGAAHCSYSPQRFPRIVRFSTRKRCKAVSFVTPKQLVGSGGKPGCAQCLPCNCTGLGARGAGLALHSTVSTPTGRAETHTRPSLCVIGSLIRLARCPVCADAPSGRVQVRAGGPPGNIPSRETCRPRRRAPALAGGGLESAARPTTCHVVAFSPRRTRARSSRGRPPRRCTPAAPPGCARTAARARAAPAGSPRRCGTARTPARDARPRRPA